MIEHNVTINGIVVNAEYSEQSVDGIFIPLLKQLTQLQQQQVLRQRQQVKKQKPIQLQAKKPVQKK